MIEGEREINMQLQHVLGQLLHFSRKTVNLPRIFVIITPTSRQDDNIKVDLGQTVVCDWIHQAQIRNQWWAL
jgi:hypothetical protein